MDYNAKWGIYSENSIDKAITVAPSPTETAHCPADETNRRICKQSFKQQGVFVHQCHCVTLQIMGRSIHAIRWAQARMAWCQALECRRASQGREQRLTAAACRSREAEEEITGWVFHIYPHLLLQHQIIDSHNQIIESHQIVCYYRCQLNSIKHHQRLCCQYWIVDEVKRFTVRLDKSLLTTLWWLNVAIENHHFE